jgi:TRAP-type C4-dicarboxylate transport system permease small subunit
MENNILKQKIKNKSNILHSISKVFNFIAATIVGATTLLVVVSSLMRYIFGKPIHFTEELGALFFMVLSVFSLAYVLTIDRHIKITIIFNRIPKTIRSYVELFSYFISIIVIAILIKLTWNFSYLTYNMKGRSPDADIPLFPWMILIPLSLTIFELILLKEALMKIKNFLVQRKSGD